MKVSNRERGFKDENQEMEMGEHFLTLCMLLSLMPMKANAAEATMVNVD